MPYDDRKNTFSKIGELREERTLVCFFNFDKQAEPPIPGLSTQFSSDVKEALFRVLKESCGSGSAAKIDLCLYTRGGDINSVWPVVSLIREFDPNFQVLVPFRCHSSGTLLALGADKIVLGPLSELSPIDPSTANQFNPRDPNNKMLAISVEDLRAYKSFVTDNLIAPDQIPTGDFKKPLESFLMKLVEQVHPLAIGNVHRVLMQIRQLAKKLLELHPHEGSEVDEIADALTSRFYSHLHMINRHEAKEILGNKIQFASTDLATALDELLRAYENDFQLRKVFFLNAYLKDKSEADLRFIGGVIESSAFSYVYETKAAVRRRSRIPQNVQIQIPAGQPMPLVRGLPIEIDVDIVTQGWIHNKEPQGVTS